MPIYQYSCNNKDCECETFETSQSYKDEALTVCPYCKMESIYRVMSLMHIAVKEVKTVGQLADKNRRAMGQYGYEDAMRKIQEDKLTTNQFVGSLPKGASVVQREAKDTPWRKATENVDTSLARMNKEQTERYVMMGKKPIL